MAATRLVMVNPLRNNCMSRACIRSFAQKVDDSNPTTSEPQDLHKLKKELNELPEKSLYWEYGQKEFGHVYDKKPVKVRCVEGKIYMWCNCGRSNSQVIDIRRTSLI